MNNRPTRQITFQHDMIHCDEKDMQHLFVNKSKSVTTPLKVVLPLNSFPPLLSQII